MAYKHLHELLNEDQEPFNLKSYINDRRCQLKRRSPETTLQVKKRKPITVSSSPLVSKRSFCKHACFLSFHDSPDVRKSPFLDFPSPVKSPCKTRNGKVMLNVPARTAGILLEAAMRIQKKQTVKGKNQIKNKGFGLFGSILKRIKDRSKSSKRMINELKVKEKAVEQARISTYETGLSCSCNNSRLSSAAWSESNEEKSFDLESSSSCRSEEQDSLENAFAACENRFCSSPFRFSLQRTTSSGRQTPDFSSPAASPRRPMKEEKEKHEAKGLNENEAENEEKEQCSPVSVLDPSFEEDNDDDAHEGGDEDEDEDEDEDDYDLECSYAIVQRAKHKLLDKLRRFERLAELDPVELEKRMIEQMDEDDYEESQDGESSSLHSNDCLDNVLTEVLRRSSFSHSQNIPADVNKLVSDIISEEKNENNDIVIRSVCEVDSNTIDMMVQLDFGREFDGWKNYQEHVAELAAEMELQICRLLVEELTEELFFY